MNRRRFWNGFGKARALLASNPKMFCKVLGCKLIRILPSPHGSIVKKINGVVFEFDFDAYGPQMKTMHWGAYEPLTIDVMRKFLKEGDIFIDVGASVGFLTATGAGLVGKAGEVHSFEPAPRESQRLEKLSQANPLYKIVVNSCAAGAHPGWATLDVSGLPWIGWNTLVPNFMRREAWKESLRVPVIRLDDYIKNKIGTESDRISLIKIDTEGFKFGVLEGLRGYFESSSHRPAILCEVTPRLYPALLGRTLDEFSCYMEAYGYRCFDLFNPREEFDLTQLREPADVLFVSESLERVSPQGEHFHGPTKASRG